MRTRLPHRIASALDRLALGASRIPVVGGIVDRLRPATIAAHEPLVEYRVGPFLVLLPRSHRLPEYRRAFPLYDTAITRLATLVHAKYPSSSVVDVGANVGDTAAAIRSGSPAPLLCVEGADEFFPILEHNARRLGAAVFLDRALVGATDSIVAGAITSGGGTARIDPSAGGRIRLEPLEQILARHRDLPAPGLVKIDTDGFDCPIVEGSMDLWRAGNPILFFEYDPDYYPGWNPLPMWAALGGAGYSLALVFENTGEYVSTVDLSDRIALENLHARYAGCDHIRYADVALFPARDSDLAGRFRDGELRAMLASRGAPYPEWMTSSRS